MNGRLRFPLHIHISTLFLMLILIVGGIIGGLGYTISRGILESSAGELSDRIGREAAREFAGILSPAEMATRLMSLDGITQADSLEARLASLGFMREALNNAGEVSGFYVGYGNGDFFLMRRLWQESERETFAAPAGTAYVVQSIEHRRIPARSLYIFFDASLKELRRDERPEFAASYDPRSRDWYKAAMAAPGQIKTPPYLFFTTRKVGITIANRSPRGDAVVGADIRLETLGRSLARQKVTPGTIIVLANQDGATIAFEDPLKSVTWPDGPQGKPALARVDQLGIPAFAGLSGILGRLETGAARDLLQEADNDTWRISIRPIQLEGLRKPLFLVTAIPDSELMAAAHQLRQQSLLAMVLVILLSVPVTWVLARLISKPLRKLSGEVEAIRHFEFSQPIEVESPVLEVGDLAATMDGMKRTIRRFMEISMAVAAENNFDRLLPRLLTETLSAADAGAGLLFLRDEDRLILASALLANGESLPASSEPIDPARFIEALSGSAAVSLETKELIRAQKRLFEGFIQLIAGAIDAKSPYTGGHCARVPELTKMLARAACDETSGPYGNFQLDDEAWEAVHVAAWLHDCGKVTTPEYVVDKATKLETLYDRIHEIRTRFEVLKRDAEIACLKAIAAGGSPQAAEAALAGTLRQLDDDYRLRRHLQRGRGIHGAGKTGAPAADCLTHLDAHARRPHRPLARRARTQGSVAGDQTPCHGIAAGGQAGTPVPARSAGHNAGRQPMGIPHAGAGAALQQGRALQPLGRARHAIGRGALQDQRAHRADLHHALATALPQAPARGSGDCRRPSRKDGRHRLSAAAAAGGTEPAGADDGDCRHLRGADRGRSPVQERQDAFGSGENHGRDEEGRAHRPRTVRALPALRDLSAVCGTLPAAGTDRQRRHRCLP
jgi:HAMP domain-containing protein